MEQGLLSDVDVYKNITINLTDLCNLSCGYCFRDSGIKNNAINFKDVQRILDFFRCKNKGGVSVVQFTGGEIFMHESAFEIIKYALSLKYVVRLQTNGMFFSKLKADEIEVLANKNVIIKISLDGWNKEAHGFYRGEKSFPRILKGIKTIRAITSQVGVKTVIHERNFPEIHKMLDLCDQLGVKSWAHNVLREGGRSKKKCIINELAVVKKILPYYNEPRYKHLLGGSNVLAYYLMAIQDRKELPLYFFIDSNGTIYVTDDTREKNKVGSIYGLDLDSEFNLKNVSNLPERRIARDILSYVKNNLKF